MNSKHISKWFETRFILHRKIVIVIASKSCQGVYVKGYKGSQNFDRNISERESEPSAGDSLSGRTNGGEDCGYKGRS